MSCVSATTQARLQQGAPAPRAHLGGAAASGAAARSSLLLASRPLGAGLVGLRSSQGGLERRRRASARVAAVASPVGDIEGRKPTVDERRESDLKELRSVSVVDMWCSLAEDGAAGEGCAAAGHATGRPAPRTRVGVSPRLPHPAGACAPLASRRSVERPAWLSPDCLPLTTFLEGRHRVGPIPILLLSADR